MLLLECSPGLQASSLTFQFLLPVFTGGALHFPQRRLGNAEVFWLMPHGRAGIWSREVRLKLREDTENCNEGGQELREVPPKAV